MIFKKQTYQSDKKTNAFIGVLLFFVSIILLAITAPLGFIYGLIYSLLTRGFRGISEYCLKMAISIDQLGNVIMQHLLNVLWIKKGGYKFGNRDETISSAIGRNKQLGTLTEAGRFIDTILDKLDPNHSLNSIDYYVEPTEQIIDKLAWIRIENHQILSTRIKGKSTYYIPCGKRKNAESDKSALLREIKDILNVTISEDSLEFIGVFEAQANGHKHDILARMTCYSGAYTGKLKASSNIEEYTWLNYDDKDKVSEVDKLIFDYLHHKGILA